MITPLFDANGNLRWFLGSQVDLGEPQSSGLDARKWEAARRISSLTARQRQILEQIAQGSTNKLIAWDLKSAKRPSRLIVRLCSGASALPLRQRQFGSRLRLAYDVCNGWDRQPPNQMGSRTTTRASFLLHRAHFGRALKWDSGANPNV